MNEFIGKYRKYLHRKSQLVSKNFQSMGFVMIVTHWKGKQ